ncbi:DNA helicase UvrA [Enterococcus hirae]
MKEQQLGYTFWGRPLYGLERRTAVSIDCACGEMIQQNIQTKQYHCKNCGNCYQFIDQDLQLLNEKNK